MATIVQIPVESRLHPQEAVAALAADNAARLLADEALTDVTAPKYFTGCVSALSSYAPMQQSYTDALKNYGEVYEQFQAYLSPLDALSGHDYDRVIAMSMPENAHLGCLNDDMVEFIGAGDAVSDDEIENCGYMGWLQH